MPRAGIVRMKWSANGEKLVISYKQNGIERFKTKDLDLGRRTAVASCLKTIVRSTLYALVDTANDQAGEITIQFLFQLSNLHCIGYLGTSHH